MKIVFLPLFLGLAGPALGKTAPAATVAPSSAAASTYTLDTPLETLIADPKAKAVVVADIGTDPSQHPMYEAFKSMSLNQIAPQSNGAIDDAKLKKLAADLAALGSHQ